MYYVHAVVKLMYLSDIYHSVLYAHNAVSAVIAMKYTLEYDNP